MRTTVLELLIWTYRDELPKRDQQGFGDGWEMVARHAETGGLDVDPMPRSPAALGAPHPDAETVASAVKRLGEATMRPDGADGVTAGYEAAEVLLGAMGAQVPAEAMARLATRRMQMASLVQSLALGVLRPPRREAWACEAVRGSDGKVVELDAGVKKETVRLAGKTMRLRQRIDWRCPLVWSPLPATVFEERLRWHLVVDALERLEADLARCGELVLWQVNGLGVAVEPWRGDVHRAVVRVLPDIGACPPDVRHVRQGRPRGRPPKRALEMRV